VILLKKPKLSLKDLQEEAQVEVLEGYSELRCGNVNSKFANEPQKPVIEAIVVKR